MGYFSTRTRPLLYFGITRKINPDPWDFEFSGFFNFYGFSRDFLGFSPDFLGFSRHFLELSRHFLGFSSDFLIPIRVPRDFAIFGIFSEFPYGMDHTPIHGISRNFQIPIPIPGISGFSVLKSALSLVLQEYFVPTLFLHLFLRNFATCF